MLRVGSLEIIIICCLGDGILTRYIQGQLKTNDNWAFLARFCFLSEHGQFEYRIEYNEEQGNPNLLLYYDTDDQWPAVYKTNKTCYEKEGVLKVEQNQIINLTTHNPRYMDLAGCISVQTVTPSSKPSSSVPTEIPQISRATHTTTSSFEIRLKNKNEAITTQPSITTGTENTTRDVLEQYQELYNLSNITGSEFENVSELVLPTTIVVPVRNKRSIKENKQYIDTVQEDKVTICQNARRFQSSRERWWFVAISNCNEIKGINIKYKLLMTNGPSGDYWHEHFSADQFYILPILLAFGLSYLLLLLAISICTVELKSRQLLHSTYKLFVLSVMLQFIGIIVQATAYLKFAVHGIDIPSSIRTGSIFMGASETCFLLLLLLLAKGYTVTRGRLPLTASVKLTVFMCLYSVTYISLFIYEANVFDPGEVLYLYQSPAGYGLIILRIIAWVMFVYSTVFTLKHYPEKSNFYYPFNVCGTLWFIAGPAFILSANSYIDKWVRESVVCAVLLLITFGGHLMFLILTMPSVANKNFPYHVRTSQIGVMDTKGSVGASTVEHFSHHAYEPTSHGNEQTVIIPLTRRTEEIFGGLYTHHLHNHFTKNINTHITDDGDEDHLAKQSIPMENVLSWSLAKNYTVAEGQDFQRRNTLGIRQACCEAQETSRKNSIVIEGSNAQPKPPIQPYEQIDYVPHELFTITKAQSPSTSKTTNSQNNESNT